MHALSTTHKSLLSIPTRTHIHTKAVRRNLNRYVWITPGWYPHGWWSSERGAPVGDSQSTQSPSSCSDSDLEQFIGNGSRVLSILQSPPHASNNSRWMEFQQMMCQEKGLKDCVYASLAYDAVWAVAEALTETGDLRAALVNSTFDGVSGSVEFDSQSYRVLGGYRLGQMRFTSGVFAISEEFLYINSSRNILLL
jgi:hypothetical protein